MNSGLGSESYPLRPRSYTRGKILTLAAIGFLLLLSLAYLFNHKDARSLLSTTIPSTPPTTSTQTANTNHEQSNIQHTSDASSSYTPPSHTPHLTTNLVIGTLSAFQPNLAWLTNLTTLTSPPIIYIVDNTSAPYHLDANHGREAAVYLKYIVEHYASPSLADVTIFWHPDNVAWHNNLLLSLSSTAAINRLSRPAVLRKRYVNARCDSWPGCPAWIPYQPSPAEQILHPGRMADGFSEGFFKRTFPNDAAESIPRYFANACCSQFAVSKAAIHSRPLGDYQRLYEWIRDDPFDSLTGRMMEYLWPFIFDKRGSGCEDAVACYCENYGLLCEDSGSVQEQEQEQSSEEVGVGIAGEGKSTLAEQKNLLRSWLDGFRRTEELGDEAGMLIRLEAKAALAALKDAKAKADGNGKTQQQGKSKEDREKAKEQEESIRKAVTKQVMATEGYKKIKSEQKEVWQMARESRRKLAAVLGLGNDAGEQSLRLD